MIQIRKANVEDAVHIALLGGITFTETFSEYFRDKEDLFKYNEKTFSVAKIKSSLQKENNAFWIAFWNELPIGYAKLKKYSATEFLSYENVSQLQKIYVLREFIGKKVGESLLEVLEKYFSESISSHLWLSVLKANGKALKFYHKNNFENIGEHGFQIGKETFDFFVLCKESGKPAFKE